MKTKVLDEYKRPVKVADDQYRYMGHFIDDQREGYRNRTLWYPWVTVADLPGAGYEPHYSFEAAKAHCKANRVDNPESKLEECFG